jgi:hypothetical protein
VGAGVHQDDAVAGAEEKFGLGYNAYAVVGYAVEEEDPTAVGVVGAYDPAFQEDAVGGADVEVFAVASAVGKGGIGFADEVGGEFSADGMEEVGGDEPASNACQDGRQEKKDQEDAD